MEYIIFDLEWNRYARAVKRKCPDEIIQIGAVKYNKNLEYAGSFSRLIRPVLYQHMEPTVEEMTGITMELLREEGVPFNRAIKEFRQFIGQDSVLMSWGMQDASILRENCLYYNKEMNLGFLKRFADLQKYATRILSKHSGQQQMGLKIAADVFPLWYDEEKLHDALVDASLSGEVFARIFEDKKFTPYIVDASQLNQHYKNIHITDLDNPAVKKNELWMHCPDCGRFLKKKRDWRRQGKKFVSLQRCKKCGIDLACTVEVLLTYGDIIKYKKRCRKLELE